MKRLIYYIFLLILSIVSIILSFNSTIIPSKYLYLIILIYFLILVLVFYLITRRKKFIRFLGIFISLFLLLGDIAIGYVYFRTNSFFSKINDIEYKTSNYSVLLLKESKITDMEEIKELGSWHSDLDTNYEEALTKFTERTDIKIKKYEIILSIVNDFLEGKIDAIMINDNYIELIDESNEGFKDKIKVLDTESIKSLTEKLDNTVDLRKMKSFNIYISGIDTYGDISNVSRSDVNIIATINLDKGKILLTNTPRDYYVQLAGTTGNKDKLTHAGYYGVSMSAKTLENLYDIHIDYYIRVNFTSLITLVDEIGGIDVYSDYDLITEHYKVHVKKGWNHF